MKKELKNKVINKNTIVEIRSILSEYKIKGMITIKKMNIPFVGPFLNIKEDGKQIAPVYYEKERGEKKLYFIVPSYSTLVK